MIGAAAAMIVRPTSTIARAANAPSVRRITPVRVSGRPPGGAGCGVCSRSPRAAPGPPAARARRAIHDPHHSTLDRGRPTVCGVARRPGELSVTPPPRSVDVAAPRVLPRPTGELDQSEISSFPPVDSAGFVNALLPKRVLHDKAMTNWH